MKYFLLVYDRSARRLLQDPHPFDDHVAALKARFDVERRDLDPDHEVVVISGEDIDSLHVTHSRYFDDAGELV